MKAETRRPKQPITWIAQALDLFKLKGHVTSRRLAAAVGKTLGGDAVMRCRQLGIALRRLGFVNGPVFKPRLHLRNQIGRAHV